LAERLQLDAIVEPVVAEIPTPAHLTATERGLWLREAMGATWSTIRGDVDYSLWRDRVAEAVIRNAGAAIFTHFVAINAAVSVARKEDAVLSFRPDHASVTVFDVEDGRLRLIELGRAAPTQVL
jgi:broad specificity phosphatase PhoE